MLFSLNHEFLDLFFKVHDFLLFIISLVSSVIILLLFDDLTISVSVVRFWLIFNFDQLLYVIIVLILLNKHQLLA